MYSTLALAEPLRFVVDLWGVVVDSSLAIPAGAERVRRIRVGQHRPRPAPVVRVVFESDSPCVAEVEREGRSLWVRLRHVRTGASPLAWRSASRR